MFEYRPEPPPPEPPRPTPLFTATRVVVGAFAFALVPWVGGSGCARANLVALVDQDTRDEARAVHLNRVAGQGSAQRRAAH